MQQRHSAIPVDNLGEIGAKKPKVPQGRVRKKDYTGGSTPTSIFLTVYYKATGKHRRYKFCDDQQVSGVLVPLGVSVIGVMKRKWFDVDCVNFSDSFGPLRTGEAVQLCDEIWEVLKREVAPIQVKPFRSDMLDLKVLKRRNYGNQD